MKDFEGDAGTTLVSGTADRSLPSLHQTSLRLNPSNENTYLFSCKLSLTWLLPRVRDDHSWSRIDNVSE